MVTKNFNTIYQALMQEDSLPIDAWKLVNTSGTSMADEYSGQTNISLNENTLHKCMKTQGSTSGVYNNHSTSGGCTGFVFGTGNDAPTIDDYKLSGDVIPTSSYTYTESINIEYGDGYTDIEALFTITNATAESITFGEIGLFSSGYLRPYTSGYYYHAFLIERTAFEIPITLEAQGIGQIVYKIRIYDPIA